MSMAATAFVNEKSANEKISAMKILEQLDARRNWSEDERIALDGIRLMIMDIMAPAAAEHDREGTFPKENVKAINQMGLNAIFVPEAYGGTPMSYAFYIAVVKMIAEACASTGIIYSNDVPRHEAGDRFRHRGTNAAPFAAHRGRLAGSTRHHRIRRRIGRHGDDDAFPRRRKNHSH